MQGRDFDLYHFRPTRSTLTLQMEGGRIVGSKLEIGIAAKWRQIEQNLVLTGIGKFDWRESRPANTFLTPKIGDHKTPL